MDSKMISRDIRPFLCCLAFLLLPAIPAHSDQTNDPTNQLTKIYAKLDSAADHKDIDGCLAGLSPDFLLLNLDGKVETLDGQRAHLAELFSKFDQVDVTTQIVKCDYTEKTATVEITQHLKVTANSTDGSKPEVLVGDLSARELWTKGATGWKIDVAQSLTAGQLVPDSE